MSDFDDVFVSVETKEPAQSKEERRAAPKEWWQIREQKEREQAYSSLDRIFADFSEGKMCIRDRSYPHHNVVFVGFDKNGKERFACQRGIATDFKGDVAGSNKKYSFAFPVNPESKRVHLFESAIDLMSYATLLQMEGMNWRRRCV